MVNVMVNEVEIYDLEVMALLEIMWIQLGNIDFNNIKILFGGYNGKGELRVGIVVHNSIL